MKRPHLTAVNHYNVYPFNHGGSLGIRGLYKGLSEWFDVSIVTFVTQDMYPEETYISKHIKVIPIVLPEKLIEMQYELYDKYGMSDDTFVDSSPAVIRWYHKFPEIVERIREIAEDSIVVLAEHVFTWNLVKTACPEKHLWYRSNNVEYDYKRTTYDAIGCPQDLLNEVFDVEKECCTECERILAVSQLEVDRFMELYDFPESYRKKFMDIHSGYDTDNLQAVLPVNRERAFSQYAFSGIFIASDTPNSRRAADHCVELARACPKIMIVLMGSIRNAYKNVQLPDNILLTGIATDEEKIYYLQRCDFALNLLEGGAGINVKMFEYFAYGIPVITTAYGARGIEINAGEDCIVTTPEIFVEDIKDFCALPIAERNRIAKNALTLLHEKYSWRNIGHRIACEIERLYNVPINESALPLEEIALYEFKTGKPYIPQKPFYIRCAGDFGIGCRNLLKQYGRSPVAFVDEFHCGEDIDGVPILSPSDYFKEQNGEEVIVANNKHWVDIAAELMAHGILPENIAVSWRGHYVFALFSGIGNYPPYAAPEKYKEKVLKRYDYYKGTV